jgi:hypothetical protein
MRNSPSNVCVFSRVKPRLGGGASDSAPEDELDSELGYAYVRTFVCGGGFAFVPDGGVSILALRLGWLRGGGDWESPLLVESESTTFAAVCAGRFFFFCFGLAFGRARGGAWMPLSFRHFAQARFLQVAKGPCKVVQGG